MEIPAGGTDLMESAKPFDFLPGFNLEGYSNRDSLHYLKEYGIEGATTCMRGTLRYKGYADCLTGLINLGTKKDFTSNIFTQFQYFFSTNNTDCFLNSFLFRCISGLLQPTPHPALHPDGPDLTWVRGSPQFIINKQTIFLNQSINRSVNQSTKNQSINQSINQLKIYQSINQSVN